MVDRVVKWDITNKCNMNCPYCLTAARRYGATDLKFEEIKHCVDLLARFARKVSLLGGEPTCLQKFPEIVKYIKEKGLSIEVVTNGLKIDSLMQLLDIVDRLVISIDGPDAKTYGIFRDERVFESVLNNARILSHRVPVDINCVVHKHNFRTVNQMLDLAHDIGAEAINFLQFIDYGMPQAKDLVLTSTEEIEALLLLGERIKEKTEVPKINVRFAYPLVIEYVNRAYNLTIPISTHMCGAGITHAYLNQSGELFPCDRIAISWSQTTKSNLLHYKIEEVVTNDLFYKAMAFQASPDTYRAWNPCTICPHLRETCFPCPVIHNGIAERAVPPTCYKVESLLKVEILPYIVHYIEPDGSRGIVFNPLHGPPLELNKTALEIFEVVRTHGNIRVRDIVEEMAKRYNKEIKAVYKDVIQTLDRLHKQGIVRYRRFSLDQGSLS